MNDPTVVALIYRIEHGKSVDYCNAEPLDREEPGFRVRVDKDIVRVEFKDHHATEPAARDAIKEYIKQWEFTAGLKHGPDAFRLSFVRPEIEDRHPLADSKPGGVVNLRGSIVMDLQLRGDLTVRHHLPHYPAPPSGVKITPDVKSMYDRYIGYRQGKEPLASMAYFCLTVLEYSFNVQRRKEAAEYYQISEDILDRIGDLSTNSGGPQARKADGRARPLADQECRFLEQAIQAVICRAARRAHNPEGALSKISLSDLPSLQSNF